MLPKEREGQLVIRVRDYLIEILGIDVQIKPWPQTKNLPYHLLDDFDLLELKLPMGPMVMVMESKSKIPISSSLRARLESLEKITGHRAVYVTEALASYERKRLITLGIPFIVPGNQLFLPHLAIDLREYYRRPWRTPESGFSPATQAVLIKQLLSNPKQVEWQPSEVAFPLGYTIMTLSRIVRELVASKLVEAFDVGRTRWLRMINPPDLTWEKAKSFLSNPVKKSYWTDRMPEEISRHTYTAGLRALAYFSELVEPRLPVYAVSPAQWKSINESERDMIKENRSGSIELQLWRYEPGLIPNAKYVDPLSLALSFENDPDDRVQIALGELRRQFPW